MSEKDSGLSCEPGTTRPLNVFEVDELLGSKKVSDKVGVLRQRRRMREELTGRSGTEEVVAQLETPTPEIAARLSKEGESLLVIGRQGKDGGADPSQTSYSRWIPTPGVRKK